MNSRAGIEHALEHGYEFSIGNYISKGLDSFKVNPLGYVGYTILFFIISIVISLIPILGFIIGLAVNPALGVGTAIYTHRQENENSQDFGNFFKGFDYVVNLALGYILQLIVYFIVAIPVIIIFGFSLLMSMTSSNPDDVMGAYTALFSNIPGLLLGLLLFMYVGISMRWVGFLIVFFGYSPVDALKVSWRLTNKNFLQQFLFMLVIMLLALLGIIALIIGIVFVIPIIMAADYHGFADVTKLNDATETGSNFTQTEGNEGDVINPDMFR